MPALLRFSPGSQDEIVAERLRTGDLVLFARDCTLYTGCAGVICAVRRAAGGCDFDQAGVIVRAGAGGDPCVLELTTAGVRLRPYDARVRRSRSPRIVVMPLAAAAPGALDAGGALRARVDAFVAAAIDAPGAAPFPSGASGAASELLALPADPAGSNASVRFALQFYSAVGVLDARGAGRVPVDSSDPAALAVACHGVGAGVLAGTAPGATARLAALRLRFGRPVWVRDTPG